MAWFHGHNGKVVEGGFYRNQTALSAVEGRSSYRIRQSSSLPSVIEIQSSISMLGVLCLRRNSCFLVIVESLIDLLKGILKVF